MKTSPEILHRNKKPRKASASQWGVKVINTQGGWVLVRGSKQIQISAVFSTPEEAQANYLNSIRSAA